MLLNLDELRNNNKKDKTILFIVKKEEKLLNKVIVNELF